MQANWSLILNVLLLIGVIIAIVRMIRARHQNNRSIVRQPSIGQGVNPPEKSNFDDIIAIRKVNREIEDEPIIQAVSTTPSVQPTPESKVTPTRPNSSKDATPTVMIFLLAKENRQLVGYELLQTVLAAGLRFGEGQLFHRHQYPNGQGPVLCSLAAATASGIFDLQNIGAFSVRGLCLYMQASGNSTIDAERFEIMVETAKQLSEGLDTHLLDDQQKPFTDLTMQRYYRLLNINDVCEPA
jgi:cell division protein ZipA